MDPLQGLFEFHQNASVATLPAYTRLPSQPPPFQLTEHVFHLPSKSSNTKTWATLKLLSGARDPKSLPTFVEGDRITGSLDINLDESGDSHIQCVKVLIRGELVIGQDNSAEDNVTFLETSHVLWSKDKDKRRPTTPNSSSRLFGEQHWKFAVPIPRTVDLPASSTMETYRLPQTFLERYTHASIRYDLIVHIARSKFRVDSNLQTTFVYIPATCPPPFSLLRVMAYAENTGQLLGPEVDPEGWMTLPPFHVNTLNEKIRCSLSLAKPLSYTRGGPLPIHLSLHSENLNVNDIIDIRLRRLVNFRKPVIRGEINLFTTELFDKTRGKLEDVARGQWWGGGVDDEHGLVGPAEWTAGCTGSFQGEIQLPRNLKPSTRISHFSIEYFIVVFPKAAPTAPSVTEVKPILEQHVEVTTMFARGPKPRSFAPST